MRVLIHLLRVACLGTNHHFAFDKCVGSTETRPTGRRRREEGFWDRRRLGTRLKYLHRSVVCPTTIVEGRHLNSSFDHKTTINISTR